MEPDKLDELRAQLKEILLHERDSTAALAALISTQRDEAYKQGYADGAASGAMPVQSIDDAMASLRAIRVAIDRAFRESGDAGT